MYQFCFTDGRKRLPDAAEVYYRIPWRLYRIASGGAGYYKKSRENMKVTLLLLFLFFGQSITAGAQGWIDRYGAIEPNSDSKKWVNGFGGWLLITSDENWREKWNSSEGTTPVFTETDRVELGGQISILTLFKNPQVDENNRININCDIRLLQPDGMVAFSEKDIECAKGELTGRRENVRLAYTVIEFLGELGDPYGIWRIEVTLTDEIAGVAISLKNRFEYVDTARLAGLGNIHDNNMICKGSAGTIVSGSQSPVAWLPQFWRKLP